MALVSKVEPKSGCLSFLVSLFRRGRICYHFKLLLPEFEKQGVSRKAGKDELRHFTRLAAAAAAPSPPDAATVPLPP